MLFDLLKRKNQDLENAINNFLNISDVDMSKAVEVGLNDPDIGDPNFSP